MVYRYLNIAYKECVKIMKSGTGLKAHYIATGSVRKVFSEIEQNMGNMFIENIFTHY